MTLLDIHIGIFMRGIEWRCYFCKILNSKGRKIDFFVVKAKKPLFKNFFEISKSAPNQLIFCTRRFFDMGNSNLKEFFDFEH